MAASFLYACSFLYLGKVFEGEVTPFVIFFLGANIVQLIGSIILYGPISFGQKLVGKQLALTSFIYFCSMIALLVVCYGMSFDDILRIILVILFSMIIYLCMIYYYICAVPYAKTAVDKFLSSYFSCCFCDWCVKKNNYEAVPLVEKSDSDDEIAA